MSAWDVPALLPGAVAGTPTVINVTLQPGAAFHLHQEDETHAAWAVGPAPTVASPLPTPSGLAAPPAVLPSRNDGCGAGPGSSGVPAGSLLGSP
eukprot:1645045-Alexandrium_andersonii.AAC.1